MTGMQTYKVWNETISFEVDRIAVPASVEELARLVEHAINNGQSLKAVGIGHSNTHIVAPRDDRTVCLSLEKLSSVKDRSEDEITVEAGLTLHDFCQELKSLGKEPYTILEYGFFHIGAICGTHAHDTNSRHSTLFASHVTGMKILSYRRAEDGTLAVVRHTFHEDTHPREMRLLRSHFGMLGIVYEVTIRTRPSKTLAIQYTAKKIDRFLDDLVAEFYEGDEEQRFITFTPDTGDVLVERRRRLDRPVSAGRQSLKKFLFFWGRLKLFFHIEKFSSGLAPGRLKSIFDHTVRKTYVVLLPMVTARPIELDPCERAVVYDGLPKFDYVEWAYPVDRIKDVLSELLRLQKKHGLANIFNLYLEKHDDKAVFSRTFDGDRISIDVVNASMDNRWRRFAAEWNGLSIQHGGIPHFNKTPGLADVVAEHGLSHFFSAERVEEFACLRDVLDPEGFFGNRIASELRSRRSEVSRN